MSFNSDAVSTVFLSLGTILVGTELIVCVFIAMIYVPKLRKEIENLLSLAALNWTELQILTSLAYFNTSYTTEAYDILTANDNWVFFNFFNGFYDDAVKTSPNQYPDGWSDSALKNVFTIILFIVFYAILYTFLKFLMKNSALLQFFEFEIGLQLLKVFTFPVGFALFFEIYRLLEGNSSSYNTGIVAALAFFVLAVYPLFKILYLRLRYLGNLESSKIINTLGGDYRAYQSCWREFHMLTEQGVMLLTAGSISLLTSFADVQILFVLIALALFVAYTAMYHPFRTRRVSIEAFISRSIICATFAIIVGYHYYNDVDFINYGVIWLLVLWYTCKVGFLAMHIYLTFGGIKKLLDKSLENKVTEAKPLRQASEAEQSKIKEENLTGEDIRVMTSGKAEDKDELEELRRNNTGSSGKKRIIRNATKDSSNENIDPRLNRKRTTRKKKTVANALD